MVGHKMQKAAAIIFLLLLSPISYACSCGEISAEDSFKEYEFVFVGKRIAKNSFLSFKKTRYTFQVSQLYKGTGAEQITLWAGKFGSSCGASFDKDIEYMVLAYKLDGKLATSICNSWEKEGYRNYNTRAVEEHFTNMSLKVKPQSRSL
jgi:hypothetical protein